MLNCNLIYLFIFLAFSNNTSNMAKLIRVEYEVFGIVQGVFFRKYTEEQAKHLLLKGWVRNTPAGTVEGVIEGPANAVQEMKTWLQTKGSPQSKIDKAVFKNEKPIPDYTFNNFSIKRG